MATPIATYMRGEVGYAAASTGSAVRVTKVYTEVLASAANAVEFPIRNFKTYQEVLVSASPARPIFVNLIGNGWNNAYPVPPSLQNPEEEI